MKHATNVSIENCTFLSAVRLYDVQDSVSKTSIINELSLSYASEILFEGCSIDITWGHANTRCDFVNCNLLGSVFSFHGNPRIHVINCTMSTEVQLGPESRIRGCNFNNTHIGICANGDSFYITDNILLGNDGSVRISILGTHVQDIVIWNNTIIGYNIEINVQFDGFIVTQNDIASCRTGIYVTGNESRKMKPLCVRRYFMSFGICLM